MNSEEINVILNNTIKTGCYIDTAAGYFNEQEVGKFLQTWFVNGGKREDIFVSSKV